MFALITAAAVACLVAWAYLYHWDRPIPDGQLSKLTGRASFISDTGRIYATIYNGSDWKVRALTLRIRILNEDGSPQLDGGFRNRIEIDPLSSETLSFRAMPAREYAKFEWSVVEARGHW